ncbi:endoribonuclease YBEY, chloroplastic isoform X2 [Capsicum annuum]|uniref:endoribonuclease YBEY, chloroplastic isoform X2 n=1 Tax=Capsicum annuum TaxID=4072 RepID=UPI0007BEF1DC|nr:endoribonuclease YBEY, chloroplastic isoform X2 [Capsicum annuum]
MLSRLSRTPPNPLAMAARALPRAFHSTVASGAMTVSTNSRFILPPSPSPSPTVSHISSSLIIGRKLHYGLNCKEDRKWSVAGGWCGKAFASQREYRKSRKLQLKKRHKAKELELSVKICIEEQMPDDPEIVDIAEMLRLNVPMAMKFAFDTLKDSDYHTRDRAINDVGCFESIELSVLLCNDEFIRELNKDWRDEDSPTDVLSMSQHIPELELPILMLGDIVISVETASRQAEERGHSLLDEIRILLVHGLLHLLGFDHEISDEAEAEMEKEEELLLKSLGWKGKGLIQSTYDTEAAGSPPLENIDRKKEGSLRFYKPKFSYIFCDMDGTLLNSKSQISSTTADALREATSRGVKVVIATGKTRPAVITLFKSVGLAGKDGIVSEVSPGVFVQGLLVYGTQGREISRRNLDPVVCREKVIFLDTVEGVSTTLRPHWVEAIGDNASVVQAQSDILEIVPPGTSKGSGVKILLDHLGVSPKEIMAIGDGENDVEMLELASLGVALSNGSEKAKAVANVIGASNDDNGAADAIYRYAF